MADVSVEFGAVDTGLQNNLKAIQNELAALENTVKTADLSTGELKKTFRDIAAAKAMEERLKALGDESSGAATKLKDLEDQMRRAEAITKANRTALEIYSETVDELQKHLDAGLISQKTYAAAIEKAEAALKAATPQTEEARLANEALEASLKQAEHETRALAEEQKKAEAITKATRTATEIYNQEIEALQNHLSAGRISMETFERAVAKADAQLAAANPQVKDLGNQVETAGDKTKTLGGIFDAEFQKIAGAFTVGNLAAQGFQKVVDLAFDAARQVVQGFADALDLGGRLNELSSRTGETAGNLLVLETAFKNSGLEAAQVGAAINKLQNFMQDAANGGDKQRAAMDGLGISMADLAGKTPTEQMQIFADKIASIEDPTQRAATASEVFGDKLGGKLLPLFSDFSGNLDDARDKVGSLEEVMDENAATFDAAAETIEAVKGKMAAFAAGVLGETIPALQDLGKSMEQVDAAGLGTSVGEFLSPRLEKLGFVVLGLVEEFKGLVDILQEVSGEGTFLGQVVDRILELNTAMQNTINFISPMDDLFNILEQKGRAAAESQKQLSSETNQATESIKGTGTAAQEATGKIEDLGTKAQTAAQNIDGVFSLGSDFAPKIDEINGSWGGLNEQILGSKVSLGENLSLADSMTGSIEEQVQALGGINESLESIVASEKQSEESKKLSSDLAKLIDETYGSHAEKLAEIQAKQDAIAAKEAEKNALQQESLNMELAIAKAKAAGDEELVKTLENQKLFNAELKKATDAGMGEPQARAFAEQMVNAKNAAASIGDRAVSVSITTKVDDTRWKDLLADIAANADPKSVQIAMQVTGQDNLNAAYATLQDMETVNKNFQAAFTTIGAQSLEELKANLEGIPTEAQRQLAMQITGEEDFDRAVSKLDSFAGTKESKLLLQAQGFENMDAFQNQLDGIVGEKRTNLLLEALGLDTVEEAKLALDRILANDGKKSAVQIAADTTEAQTKIASLGTTPQPITLDASKSIENIKSEFKKNMDLAISTGEGSKILGEIRGFVETIKGLVEKIEPKLPVAALV